MAKALDKGFNGTTVTFANSPLTGLVSVRYTSTCAKADDGDAGDTEITYDLGRATRQTVVTVKGATTLADGATGALAVVWNDAATSGAGSMTLAIVSGTPVTGKIDDVITSTITFVDADAAT
jgi:hypothetical protein